MWEGEAPREARLSFYCIPSGRQLPRTPPLRSVKKQLDFCNQEENEPLQQSAQPPGAREQDDADPNATFEFNASGTKSEPEELDSMLTGMKGYQLTQTDLDFMERIRGEKLIKKLQGDLQEVQRSLQKEMMPLELASASMKKAEAELQKFPSCEDIAEWLKLVLNMTSPSVDSTDLDAKSLLAMVTVRNVQRAEEEKRKELARMEKMAANKRKKEAQAKGKLEKRVACEQLKIQGLMSLLSDLKAELAQQEEVSRALQIQIDAQEAAEVDVGASEEPQAAKKPARGRGKGRAKAPKPTKKSKGPTDQSNPTGRKLGDGQRSGKDEQEGDGARGPAQKAQEPESSPRGAAPRRRRRPPSQAESGEETQPPL